MSILINATKSAGLSSSRYKSVDSFDDDPASFEEDDDNLVQKALERQGALKEASAEATKDNDNNDSAGAYEGEDETKMQDESAVSLGENEDVAIQQLHFLGTKRSVLETMFNPEQVARVLEGGGGEKEKEAKEAVDIIQHHGATDTGEILQKLHARRRSHMVRRIRSHDGATRPSLRQQKEDSNNDSPRQRKMSLEQSKKRKKGGFSSKLNRYIGKTSDHTPLQRPKPKLPQRRHTINEGRSCRRPSSSSTPRKERQSFGRHSGHGKEDREGLNQRSDHGGRHGRHGGHGKQDREGLGRHSGHGDREGLNRRSDHGRPSMGGVRYFRESLAKLDIDELDESATESECSEHQEDLMHKSVANKGLCVKELKGIAGKHDVKGFLKVKKGERHSISGAITQIASMRVKRGVGEANDTPDAVDQSHSSMPTNPRNTRRESTTKVIMQIAAAVQPTKGAKGNKDQHGVDLSCSSTLSPTDERNTRRESTTKGIMQIAAAVQPTKGGETPVMPPTSQSKTRRESTTKGIMQIAAAVQHETSVF